MSDLNNPAVRKDLRLEVLEALVNGVGASKDEIVTEMALYDSGKPLTGKVLLAAQVALKKRQASGK